MARLKIEDVRKEIEQYDWKLISEEYKNLDSELLLECPESHRTYISFKKFRRSQKCPTCEANPFKEQDTKVISKKDGTQRFLALDQATYKTGWAIYDGTELVKYGVFETSFDNLFKRINDITEWLLSMLENWNPDKVAIEDIQYQENSTGRRVVAITTYKMLAQLQGAVINTLEGQEIPYEIILAGTWRSYCQIKGRKRADVKRNTQILVKRWFDISVSDDAADAIALGKYLSETNMQGMTIEDWE